MTVLHLKPHFKNSHGESLLDLISVQEIQKSANPLTAVDLNFQWLSKTNPDKAHRAILLPHNSLYVFTEATHTHKPDGFVLPDFIQVIRSGIDLESPCMALWGCYSTWTSSQRAIRFAALNRCVNEWRTWPLSLSLIRQPLLWATQGQDRVLLRSWSQLNGPKLLFFSGLQHI